MDRVLVVAVSGDCGPVILLSSGSNLEPAKIFSLFLSIRFGEMVEKYFIIFKQKWNKGQSFFHRIRKRFELEQFGACYRDYSFFTFSLLSFLHGLENGEMVEKYFIIFKQKWNKGQSSLSNCSNSDIFFLFNFSSPLLSYTIWRNGRKAYIVYNFQCMRRNIGQSYARGRPSSGSRPPSRIIEMIHHGIVGKGLFQLPLDLLCPIRH